MALGEDLPQLWEKYCTLPADQKGVFDELSCKFDPDKEAWLIQQLSQRGYDLATAQEMARVNAQWQANAFKNENTRIASQVPRPPSESGLRWAYSLFANVARINHSCGPNARASYAPASGAEAIYSVCDIASGEEIEIAYFDLTLNRTRRKTRTEDWNFTCRCRACEMSTTDYKIYAPLLHDIRKERNFAELLVREGSANRTIQGVEEGTASAQRVQALIDLVLTDRFPWLVVMLPELYQALFGHHMHVGKAAGGSVSSLKRARAAVKRAVELEEGMTGTSGFWREFLMRTEKAVLEGRSMGPSW